MWMHSGLEMSWKSFSAKRTDDSLDGANSRYQMSIK